MVAGGKLDGNQVTPVHGSGLSGPGFQLGRVLPVVLPVRCASKSRHRTTSDSRKRGSVHGRQPHDALVRPTFPDLARPVPRGLDEEQLRGARDVTHGPRDVPGRYPRSAGRSGTLPTVCGTFRDVVDLGLLGDLGCVPQAGT